MKKNIILIIISLLFANLFCFNPKQRHFYNQYQYKLFESWIKKGQFRKESPGFLSTEKIIMNFANADKDSILVIFEMKDYKIIKQRETTINPFPEDNNWLVYQRNIEDFLFRINTLDLQYIRSLYDSDLFSIKYSDKVSQEAISEIFYSLKGIRLRINDISCEITNNVLICSLSSNIGVIELTFLPSKEIEDSISRMQKNEELSSNTLKIENIITQKKIEFSKKIKANINSRSKKWLSEFESSLIESKIKAPSQSVASNGFKSFLEKSRNSTFRKKILNNSIKDPINFLKKEFPHHNLVNNSNSVDLKINTFDLNDGLQKISGNISVDLYSSEDGISITPATQYENKGNILNLGDENEILCKNLTEGELETISPYLSQLALLHRSIGSELFHFFLIPDSVPTTLVLYENNRELFEMDSYDSLLFILNQYWMKKNIYFSISEVKKVNSFIEFKGYLVAQNKNSNFYDFAEVRFHLNKEFNLDLIMMILHPDVSS